MVIVGSMGWELKLVAIKIFCFFLDGCEITVPDHCRGIGLVTTTGLCSIQKARDYHSPLSVFSFFFFFFFFKKAEGGIRHSQIKEN
jgi:hypothetical protein